MFARDDPEQDAHAFRYLSGPASQPAWVRALDGYVPDTLVGAVLAALVLWLFRLW